MSGLLKRGMKAYMIFLQNKLVACTMMLMSGIMMTISGFNGNGNDTKTIPTFIILIGAALSLWTSYRVGYIHANIKQEQSERQTKVSKKALIITVLETILCLLVVCLGVFLINNEQLMNTVLNIMAGGFSILNGVFGVIYLVQNRQNIDNVWKFKIILTVLEFALGIYFILTAQTIGLTAIILLGILTTVAGTLEMILTLSVDSLKGVVKDGKDIVKTLKNDNAGELKEG